jgi:NAD(P)-dependent dehydrogenase (short-subunit alcohol dehydrogenase family)
VIAVGCDTGDDQSVRDMVLAVTDGLGGVDIPVNAAARPDTGTVAGIDAFDDSEFSEQSTPRYSGQALPGERLLRDEGLLELRRGHGITVAGTRSAAPCSPRPGNWSG